MLKLPALPLEFPAVPKRRYGAACVGINAGITSCVQSIKIAGISSVYTAGISCGFHSIKTQEIPAFWKF